MTLAFPNESRSYDEEARAVRFLGHDGMFEVLFLVEAAALAKPGSVTETHCLAAFDAARGAIHRVARKIYKPGRRITYVLTVEDFR
jgi:hypothetical protein